MKTRYIAFIILLLSVLPTFADKKMTIRNIDTGESFDVTVPEGLKMSLYEYNDNWLDSVPYLVDHAKWKEPWAYEALAKCYRYGNGGIEKSLFNALMCYEEAGLSASKVAEQDYEADPYDELGVLNYIMEGLDKKRLKDNDIISLIGDMPDPKPYWMIFLKEILTNKPEDRLDFIKSKLSTELTSDEILIGFCFLSMIEDDYFNKSFIGVTENTQQMIRYFGEKMPAIYDVSGERLWRKQNYQSDNSDKYRTEALKCMYLADQAGFLSKANMRRILSFCEENGKGSLILFTDKDLERFEKITQNSYQNHIHDDEECVEIDDCPVELIEDND